MSLPLNKHHLEAAYEYMRSTPPFRNWNLPDGEDVIFRVVRTQHLRGWYRRERGRHVIAVSGSCNGFTDSVMRVMAHEMIHLHEAKVGACTSAMHSAAFLRWAAQVCKVHGFDPKMF